MWPGSLSTNLRIENIFLSVPGPNRFVVMDDNIQHTSLQTDDDVTIFISVMIRNIF